MKSLTTVVDWQAYAQQYDLLLTYNPYYQEALQQVIQEVKNWRLSPGDRIADLGAGTGNYSVRVAQLHPQAQILHLERNRGMNALAAKKAGGLANFQLIHRSIREAPFQAGELQGILCINALYTFPEPAQMLAHMFTWLQEGGQIVLLDPGRIMDIMAWRLAIGKHLLRNYGLRQTLRIFRQGKMVSQQNALIREQQVNGTYWTHSPEEFVAFVENAGFRINYATTCFREDCDLVFAEKPRSTS
jgi:ubiquinone/menaquinone biosynthesis C-methylase UbiE